MTVAQAMGAPQPVLHQLREQLEARRAASVFRVWPEHWHAVTVFRLMGTQWRAVPMPAPARRLWWLGLDYSGLQPPMRAARVLVDPAQRQPLHELLLQLQTMEAAAVDARNAT